MSNRKRQSVRGSLLVVACLVSVARADDTLVLQSAGANSVMGGVYTSPYGITVNGTPTLLICDDFTTDISLGQTWTAAPTALTTVDAGDVGSLKFANAPYISNILGATPPTTPLTTVAADYAVAAVLAAELETLPNIGTPAENTEVAGELSYALWGVFDAPLLTSINTGYGTLTGTELSVAKADLASAQALVAAATGGAGIALSNISVNGVSLESMTVYTPTSPSGLASSQEFITVATPEPSFWSIFALDLLAAASLGFIFRRRRSSIGS